MESTKVEKDLGVYVDEESKFHGHISLAVNMARMLWFTKKTFSCLEKTLCLGCIKYLSDLTWNMRTPFAINTIRGTNWQWKRFTIEQQS